MDFLRRQNAAKYMKAVKKEGQRLKTTRKRGWEMLQSGGNGTKGPDAYHFGDEVMVK
jgi:hypothetical protein